MDPNSVLAQLRDIQPPEAISAWPPAIGWWLLAIIVALRTRYNDLFIAALVSTNRMETRSS